MDGGGRRKIARGQGTVRVPAARALPGRHARPGPPSRARTAARARGSDAGEALCVDGLEERSRAGLPSDGQDEIEEGEADREERGGAHPDVGRDPEESRPGLREAGQAREDARRAGADVEGRDGRATVERVEQVGRRAEDEAEGRHAHSARLRGRYPPSASRRRTAGK